jgi:hypothetical protein
MKNIETFFFKQPKQKSLFLAVEQMIHSIGPATIQVMKSQISFGTHTKFAWVWLSPPSNKRPENSIVLTFGVGRHIESEQIVQAVEPYPGRWTHHVIIQNEADLNNDVNQWLREAYAFSQSRGKGIKHTLENEK